MRALIIVFLFLNVVRASGQSIHGRVLSEDGVPIPGANLVIEGTLKGTATDENGRFTLNDISQGTIVLRASAIGFFTSRKSVRLRREDSIELDFTLVEKILPSDGVVVTASRREQPALSVPVSVTVLSAKELTRRNVLTLDDILKTVSGVHVLGNQINIRGSGGFAYNTGSRVLLMLDGMPLLTPDSDGIPLEALPMSEIERIEVLKGPGSALYGSGALGGVINVISRKLPDTPTTTVRAFSGTWEPVRHKIWRDGWTRGNEYRPFWGVSVSHAERRSPKFGWWANTTFRRDSGFTRLSGRDVFHGFTKTSWRPKPSYKLETLLGIMIRQQDNFIFWASARDALSPGRISFGESSPGSDSSPNGALDNFVKQISLLPVFTHFVNSHWFYEIKGRVFGSLIQPIDDETGKRKKLSEGTAGVRYGAEIQANWIPGPSTRVVLGGSRDAIVTRSSFFVTSDGDELGSLPEAAAFAHLETQLRSRLQLVAGLRFDHYRIDSATSESALSPKISLAYEWRKRHFIRLAWGRGFRVPSFAERFTDNQDFLPIVRNLELKPERSESLEFGIRGVVALGGAFSWDASGFWNTYRGFIEPRLVLAEQAFQFINLPQARIVGAEIQLAWQSESETIRASIGYTLLHTEEVQSGEELPFRARHHLVTSIDAAVWGPFRAGLDYRFISRPNRVESDFARFVPDAEIMVDTRILDLRVSAEKGSFSAAILINNALEYHYVERPALLGEPRRYTFQITYQR